MNASTKVVGVLQVWDNGLSCEAEVTHAIVLDMDAMLARARAGQALALANGLKAVRMDYHPDQWVGSETIDLLGLEVTSDGIFTFLHTGYVGTVSYSIEETSDVLSKLKLDGISWFSDTFSFEEVQELLSEMGITHQT